MTNLISGKEALIALANGDEVEWTHFSVGEWHKVPQKTAKLQYFLDDDLGWKFRIKPRTIILNGIEVPAPFKPKEFEDCYMLTDLYEHGYTMTSWKYCKQVPAWRTEDEIQQVVAALRQVFGGV